MNSADSKVFKLKDRYLILGAFFIIILETTILNAFRIGGCIPDIMMIAIIIISVIYDRFTGLKSAFYGGIISDLIIGRGIGVYVLAYLAIVVVIILLDDIIFKDNYVTPLVLIFTSTLFFQIYMLVIDYLYLGKYSMELFLFGQLIPTIIYNIAVGVPLYTFLFKKFMGYNMR